MQTSYEQLLWCFYVSFWSLKIMVTICFCFKKKRASPFAFYRTKKNALKTWGWINELLLDNSTKNLNAAIISSKRGLKLGLSADTSERDCWRVLTETAGVSEWSMCVGLLSQPSLSVSHCLNYSDRAQKPLQIQPVYVYKQYILSAHPSILLHISQRHDVKMAFISVFWLEGGLERLPGLLSCSVVFVYAVKLSHWDSKTSKSRAWQSWKHSSHTYKCQCIITYQNQCDFIEKRDAKRAYKQNIVLKKHTHCK